jgi:acyl carrier protein
LQGRESLRSGVAITAADAHVTSGYPLALTVTDRGGRLEARIAYFQALFRRCDSEVLLDNLLRLIKLIVETPGVPINEINDAPELRGRFVVRREGDRTNLPARAEPRTASSEVLADRERRMAGLFAETLGTAEPITAFDSFFDLGGHSMLAVRLLSRIRAVFEVEVPMRAIYDDPTVAGMAKSLEDAPSAPRPLSRSPVTADDDPVQSEEQA